MESGVKGWVGVEDWGERRQGERRTGCLDGGRMETEEIGLFGWMLGSVWVRTLITTLSSDK